MRITRNDDYWKYSNMFQKKRNVRNNTQELYPDPYIPSTLHTMQTQKKKILSGKECSKADLDYINFENATIAKMQGETIDTIAVGNRVYYIKDLPEVEYSRCRDIQAKDNKVVLENKQYYRYQDSSGNKYVLACCDDYMEQPYADWISGKWDRNAVQICFFWNLMSTDGTYINLYFSEDQEKKMLNDAGITEGFFSVQVGNCKQDYFYSHGTSGLAVKKREYDIEYNALTQGTSLLTECEPGTVFKFGGNEYVLNENHRFEIPYGEDIFDIQGKIH